MHIFVWILLSFWSKCWRYHTHSAWVSGDGRHAMSTWWEFLILTSDLQSMVHKDLWGTYNYWTATLCCIHTVNHSSFARFPKCHCVWLDEGKLSPCHGRRCDYRGRATEQRNCPSWSWRLGNFKLDREQWKESGIQHQMRQLDNHASLVPRPLETAWVRG